MPLTLQEPLAVDPGAVPAAILELQAFLRALQRAVLAADSLVRAHQEATGGSPDGAGASKACEKAFRS